MAVESLAQRRRRYRRELMTCYGLIFIFKSGAMVQVDANGIKGPLSQHSTAPKSLEWTTPANAMREMVWADRDALAGVVKLYRKADFDPLELPGDPTYVQHSPVDNTIVGMQDDEATEGVIDKEE